VTWSLDARTVFITGAARGIGAELARQLAARGAGVALAGLEPERLAALAGELGPDHAWFECDVTNQFALEAAVAGTVRRFSGIDVVVANAGIASNGTVAVTPADALARVIDVNLTGVIRTVSATLPHVTNRKGYFLLISSAAAFAGLPGLSAYAASKAGVEQFGNAVRLELAHEGVDVGTAHPSWIDTDLVRDAKHDLGSFNDTLRSLPGPLGRVTPVDECAAALVDAIERRRRRVYIPKSVGVFAAPRQLFTNRVAEAVIRRRAMRMVPRLESEVRAIGRSFGEHSVETKK
jgi:NAD(P)-dependent dehydrogenase (short-subunit alcohol dehydrogenase family)